MDHPLESLNLSGIVIDDHPAMRKAIARVLAKLKFGKVVECSSGNQAIQELSKGVFDMVITDLYMTHGDGFHVIEHIRAASTREDIPVIVVTGEAHREDIMRTSDIGATDYLLKPFQIQELEEKIVSALNKIANPSPSLEMIRRAEKLMFDRQIDSALELFSRACELEPTSAKAQHSLAVGLIAKGNLHKAEQILTHLTVAFPKYYRSYVRLADLKVRSGDISGAIEHLQKELDLHPKQPVRQTLLGQLLLQSNLTQMALERFREALKIDSKYRKALVGMAQGMLSQQNWDKALYYFKRIRRNYPDDRKALEQCVKIFLDRKQDRQAELFLKDEIKPNQGSPDGSMLLCKLLISQNRLEESLSVLDRVDQKFENLPEHLEIRGHLELKLKKYQEAVATLKKLAKLSPGASSFASLGEAMLAIGDTGQALHLLTKAAKKAPRSGKIMTLLADTYSASNQAGKAYLSYLRAATLLKTPETIRSRIVNCESELMMRRTRSSNKVLAS